MNNSDKIKTRSNAHANGRRACGMGKSRTDNPYKVGSESRADLAWREGFDEQRLESMAVIGVGAGG